MPLGSFANYADPRDEKMMKRRMIASGLLPTVGKSHMELMHKQLETIKRGNEVNQVRERRMQQDARITHQLQMERMHGVLRQARVPGLRGAAAARMNANNVAEQIY
jgi:truncated hemoglobin YjbI